MPPKKKPTAPKPTPKSTHKTHNDISTSTTKTAISESTSGQNTESNKETLLSQWKTLYTKTLPQLAHTKSPVQKSWPVNLDHCFARIILDNTIGDGKKRWDEVISKPAVKNMTEEQVRSAVELGRKIESGEVELVGLDEVSLRCRGKKSKIQRKMGKGDGNGMRDKSDTKEVEGERKRKAGVDGSGSEEEKKGEGGKDGKGGDEDVKGRNTKRGRVIEDENEGVNGNKESGERQVKKEEESEDGDGNEGENGGGDVSNGNGRKKKKIKTERLRNNDEESRGSIKDEKGQPVKTNTTTTTKKKGKNK